MKSTTFTEVQAVLLNSEGNPHEEVIAALESIAEFAYTECELNQDQFAAYAYQAWLRATKRVDEG